jgi:threonine dehydratase
VPVGGGGLISGIATAVKGLSPDTRVIGVEPETSAALHLALEAGERVEIKPVSVADGLNAPHAGRNALEIAKERVDEVVLVTEAELEEAFRLLYSRAKLAVEPAGAASTAALIAGKIPHDPGEHVALVVSGGNVSAETASAILASR